MDIGGGWAIYVGSWEGVETDIDDQFFSNQRAWVRFRNKFYEGKLAAGQCT